MSDEIKKDEDLTNAELTDQNDEISADESELHDIMYGVDYKEYSEDLGTEEKEEGSESNLSTFATPVKEKKKREKKTTHIKKQTKIIIILSAVFAFILAMFLILGPTGFDVFGFKQTEEKPLELVEGEVLIGTKRRLMFKHIERENIQKIEVHNDLGSYTVYYNKMTETFYFEGAEEAPYDGELFSALVTASGYTMIKDRLGHDERATDYSEYGLGDSDTPAYYILTTRDGEEFKVYVGSKTLDNSGYYVKLDGRDEIYVIASETFYVFENDMKSFLTPIVTFPISTNDYYTEITKVYIRKDGDAFVGIKYTGDSADSESTGVTIPYEITYPKYFPASTSQIQTLYSQIVNLTGDEIIEYGITEIVGKDENGDNEYAMREGIAEKYGLENPAFEFYYEYTEAGYVSDVFFSKKQTDEDGKEFYYAASLIFDTIVKIDAEKLTFFNWSLADYIDRTIFNYHIDYVKSLEISEQVGDKRKFNFVLSGTGKNLSVIERESNTVLTPNPEGTDEDVFDDVYNFRQFYITSLSITNEDFTEEPEEKVYILDVNLTLKNEKTINYKFYTCSERHCYYTINGEGEFYISRSMITKLLNDAQKVIDRVEVDSSAES